MTPRNVPSLGDIEVEGRVGATPLSGARFLVGQLLADLDATRAFTEQQLADAGERRGALREQLDDAESLRAHVMAHIHRLHARDVDEAFERVAELRTELTVVEDRARLLGERIAEMNRTVDALRAVHRCLEDLSSIDGSSEADGVARFRSASRQVFQIIEEERLRIARDMHDGPAQAMANIVLAAEVLERLVERDPELMGAELTELKNGARTALDDMRRLIFDLRPMSLDDVGLVPTLRRLVREFSDRTGIQARFHVAGDDRRLSHALEAVVFRIVQEALTNVRRHARATHVEVVLTQQSGRVAALVRDDGEGFDVAATQALQGRTRTLGLLSMRERAALEDGRLEIRSEIGRGTEVRVSFDA